MVEKLMRVGVALSLVIGLAGVALGQNVPAYTSKSPTSYPAPEKRDFGVGLALFGPNGLSVKYWLLNNQAVDGALSWSLHNDWMYLHSDYLIHMTNLMDEGGTKLNLHFGVGARVLINNDDDDDDFFGVRVPVGLDVLFHQVPIEAFGEVALLADVVEVAKLSLQLTIGGRYYVF